MLYNINPISLHCVFHGIRFKVNKDWLSGIDSLLFLYTPASSFFAFLLSPFPINSLHLRQLIKSFLRKTH